jgi:hypothetical protein
VGHLAGRHEKVEEFCATAAEGDFADVDSDYTEETDNDYGCLEVRP